MTTEAPQQSIGERMKEAFGDLDMKASMRIVFGKCPVCGVRLVRGSWMRWCPDRACQKYVGVLNKEAGRSIEYVKPRSPEEERTLRLLADEFGIETTS